MSLTNTIKQGGRGQPSLAIASNTIAYIRHKNSNVGGALSQIRL